MDINQMGKMYVEINVHYDGEHVTTVEEMLRDHELDWIPNLIRERIKNHRIKVYCSHWSDAHQKWDKPKWIEENLRELGLPFGYFLANSDEEAEEFVKTLPPLRAVTKKKCYPNEFTLGWAKIPDGVDAIFVGE